MSQAIAIALLGQPNSGKSTLFNALTGLRQHVGNWRGKTVEKKEGFFTYKGMECTVAETAGAVAAMAAAVAVPACRRAGLRTWARCMRYHSSRSVMLLMPSATVEVLCKRDVAVGVRTPNMPSRIRSELKPMMVL